VEISGATLITVVYKTNGGVVRGTAEKCASGSVWLVPQDRAMRRQGFWRTVTCDAKDRYEITAVRPGEYYAVALTVDRLLPWSAVVFDEGLLNQGEKVTVRAGENSSADLRAITRAGYF
jgi:hypothetical protein